jgi:hypothetical protein
LYEAAVFYMVEFVAEEGAKIPLKAYKYLIGKVAPLRGATFPYNVLIMGKWRYTESLLNCAIYIKWICGCRGFWC